MKKSSMFLAGVLIILAGALPFLIEQKIIPISVSAASPVYNIVVVLLGVWVLFYSLSKY
ncbi:MAG: hypothetical protein KKG60_02090 [Nanoarchaeota archaeon]|nr:hypothetical protein [Nanoarchaeota archaeon]